MLAALARLAEGGRVAQTAPAIAGETQPRRRHRLVAGVRGRLLGPRPQRGDSTGPNPTDRGKAGCKPHLAADTNGVPLVVQQAPANRSETTLFPGMIDALPTLARRRGRPRWKPGKVHADKGYDSRKNRDYLEALHITPRIARRGVESREKSGRHRWVVERPFAWLHRMRRLRIRCERRDDIHEAFLLLGCVRICWNFLAKGE